MHTRFTARAGGGSFKWCRCHDACWGPKWHFHLPRWHPTHPSGLPFLSTPAFYDNLRVYCSPPQGLWGLLASHPSSMKERVLVHKVLHHGEVRLHFVWLVRDFGSYFQSWIPCPKLCCVRLCKRMNLRRHHGSLALMRGESLHTCVHLSSIQHSNLTPQ